MIAASRNLGIREASGEWIAFLDSDDCWYPTKLETTIEMGETTKAYDVICSNESIVNLNSGTRRLLRHGPYENQFYRALLLKGNRLSPSATSIRRRFLLQHGLQFNETPGYVTVEDYDLWLRLALAKARFQFVDEVLGEYVIHDRNSSGHADLHLNNLEHPLRDHVFKIQTFTPDRNELWRLVSTRLRLARVRLFAESGDLGSSFHHATTTLFSSPVSTVLQLLWRYIPR